MPFAASPTHSALKSYYATLASLAAQNATHESATRLAFSNLLLTFAPLVDWTLIPEDRLRTGKRPDATLKDALGLPRGYWEAKDIHDKLDAEIAAKKKIAYPLDNTIFEDTRQAVLYQNGREVQRFDLKKPEEVATLLTRFFNHTTEDIEEFKRAVEEFHSRIPRLAKALRDIIAEAYGANVDYRSAFDAFHRMCATSLNPKISRPAIEEMLVQHLLTERLFRTVLDSAEFRTRNVIALEVERVIEALTLRKFNRQEFLKALDPFYLAIEKAGRDLSTWSEKQSFLNTVYERFFQKYSTEQADTHGIVYTPQPIVNWMCASVQQVLAQEFGKSLSTRGVKILDPCTGTGNFVVNLLGRIERGDLKHKYDHDLFANEVMLLPYYVASMNIEHEFYSEAGEYRAFEGLCFSDTLDVPERNLFSERNTERVEREQAAELTVIIGNPPYNVGQKNENDNNKNRAYKSLDREIRDTYARASAATNKKALWDAYVRFFKWASGNLIEPAVVCPVSSLSLVSQNADN